MTTENDRFERMTIIIQYSSEDKGFIATLPNIIGVSSFGETPETAIKKLRVAYTLFVEEQRDLLGKALVSTVKEISSIMPLPEPPKGDNND